LCSHGVDPRIDAIIDGETIIFVLVSCLHTCPIVGTYLKVFRIRIMVVISSPLKSLYELVAYWIAVDKQSVLEMARQA
jgi:hypothetical protein